MKVLEREPARNSSLYLNRDDRFCDYFESVTSTDTITYGFSQEADVRAHEAETGPKGSVFTLSFAGKDRRVRIGLPGKFNIANALAASALGFGIGMGIDEVAVVLSEG